MYSNNIFSLYEYSFTDINNYSSLQLVRHRNYSVEDTVITSQDILDVLHRVRIANEPPNVPFSQADNFERVINLCELLSDHDLSKHDITNEYAFNERQADYYANAGRYLGLINRNGTGTYTLSDTGRKILSMSWKNKQLALCELILSHNIFHETISTYFTRGYMPCVNEIICVMKSSGLHNVISSDTIRRRAATIKSWLNWIISLITQ